MSEAPIAIRKKDKYWLECEWSDGFKAALKLETFRKECPCAVCRKDELNQAKPKTGAIPILQTFMQGENELISIHKVGNYAIQVEWGDGHNTGIYTWQYLREVFERNKIS